MRMPALLVAALLLGLALAPESRAQLCDGTANCCEWDADGTRRCTADPAAYDGLRLALVVGTDSYEHAFGEHLEDLENARRDAHRIGTRLERLGFSVRYVFNPTVHRLEGELAALRAAVLERESRLDEISLEELEDMLAVVYVAGHGMSFREGSGQFAEFLIMRPEPSPGPAATLARHFRDSRYRLSGLERVFEGFRAYKVLLLFDVCRSLSALPDEALDARFRGQDPTWIGRQPLSISIDRNTKQYSTSSLQPAADSSEIADAGLYASRLGMLLEARGLSVVTIANATRLLVAAQGDQVPTSLENSRGWMFEGLSAPQTECQKFESLLWTKLGGCTDFDSLCQRQVCSAVADTEPELLASCRPERFESTYDARIEELCPQVLVESGEVETGFHYNVPDQPVVAGLGIHDASPSPTEAAGEALGIARHALAVRPGTEALATAGTAGAAPGQSPALGGAGAARLGDVALRDRLLRPAAEFETGIGQPVAPREGFTLRATPRDSGPVIVSRPSALPDGAELRLDCVNVPCGNGWLGVTVHGGSTYTRGFARMDTVAARPADRVLVLNLPPGETTLGPKRAQAVHGLVRAAIEREGFMQILFQAAGARLTLDERLILSRLEQIALQARIDGRGMRPANLLVQPARGAGGGGPRAILQLWTGREP